MILSEGAKTDHSMRKGVFSTNGSGKTKYPYTKE